MIRIASDLPKELVLSALRNSIATDHGFRPFQSGLEGEVGDGQAIVAFRFGWFIPPVRIATFRGRAAGDGDKTTIEGNVSSNWIVYFFIVWFLVAVPMTLFQIASSESYSSIFWNLVFAAVLLLLGRYYVRSTHQHIVDELCRITRGKVVED